MLWLPQKDGYVCLNRGWLIMKKTKKIETSKLLLWLLLSGLGIITLFAIIFSFSFKDASPLIALIEKAYPLASIAVGFYYWKAKNENLHKYKQDNKIGDNRE